MLRCEAELLPLAAPDAELVDAAIAEEVMAAAEHTGVAEMRAEVVVPQVRMSIEVNDFEIRILRSDCAHGTEGHEVLTAEQQWQLAILQDLRRAGLDVLKRHLARTEAEFEVSAVKYLRIHEVPVLIRAVGLEAEALVPHRRRAEACPWTEAGGRIKRRAVEHDVGFLVARVTADKVFNIWCKHQCPSTSRSISSRKAGR